MIIYLPLESIEMRYTSHLDRDVTSYLKQSKKDHMIIPARTMHNQIKTGSFLDSNNTVYRQMNQIADLCQLLNRGKIPKGSHLFVTDLWNFGLMSIPYLNFFGNHDLKVSGIIHAGSFTDTDFVRQMERVYKGMEESIFDLCTKIYVGSDFIRNDIIQKRFVDPKKLVVTGLPLDYIGMANIERPTERENAVIFNGRMVDEKQPWLLDELQKRRPAYKYYRTHEMKLSKPEYYELMANSKCVISFALQENFGYGIYEGVNMGCVPVVPDRLAYVEQYPKRYRYRLFHQAMTMVDKVMAGTLVAEDIPMPNNHKIFKRWFRKK